MADQTPEPVTFPPELRDPKLFNGCRYHWHDARATWLRENGIRRGILSEIRAMTHDWLSDELAAHPDHPRVIRRLDQ